MIICIVGLPGSGKSTLSRKLSQRLEAPVLHPGKFAFAQGIVASPFTSRSELLAVEQLSERFLGAVGNAVTEHGTVILDGFPRTREQAKKLVETGWELKVVHLMFPAGQATELSVARQEQRVKADGVSVERSHLQQQAELGSEHDLAAIDELSVSGIAIGEVDAMQAADEVELRAMRLCFNQVL